MKRTQDIQAQKQAILERLTNNKPSKWKLERAIWRAGELQIKEAAPLLTNLIGTGEPLRDYCIAWTLGWCGSEESIPILQALQSNSANPEFVQRIAFEALLKLVDAQTKVNLQLGLIEKLPTHTQILARATSAEFEEFATTHPYSFFAVLDQIYQIDNELVRPALLNILRTVPFQPNYFRAIRRIFKIAEYRRDAKVFAILAYRFEQEPGNFDNNLLAYSWNEEDGKYLTSKRRVYSHEQEQDEPSFVYSYQTQQYLRRRVWRTLRKLGEVGDSDYIKMAVAILLEYFDGNTPPIRRSTFDKWDYYQREVIHHWDAYADYLTFNHILYTNSYRYEFTSKSWRRRKGYQPSLAEPNVREEAFPELWQQHPHVLLQLLRDSKCRPVQHFAVNILRECKSFCASLNVDTIITLVNSSYIDTVVFGFELALQSLNGDEQNQILINALTQRIFQYTTTQQNYWEIEENKFIQENIQLIANLLTSPDSKTRNFANKLLSSYIISNSTASLINKHIIDCVILKIFKLLALAPNQIQQAKLIIDDLVANSTAQLGEIDYNHLLMLLAHPILEVQELGALIIIYLYDKEITSKVTNLYDIVYLISIERVDKWRTPKAITIGSNLIIAIAQNPFPEIRNVIKPIFRRLAIYNRSLQFKIAVEFIQIIENSKTSTDICKFLVKIVQENINIWAQAQDISKEFIYKLLQANYDLAQLASLVLEVNPHISNDFTTEEIIELAKSRFFNVRKAVQTILLQSLKRIRIHQEEIIILIGLLNSDWQDSRQLGAKIFTDEIKINELTSKIIITICDTDKEEARMLGLNLLKRYLHNTQKPAIIIQFIQQLILLEKHPSIYKRIVQALQENIQDWISDIDKNLVFKILQAKSSILQEFGFYLLNSDFDRFALQLTTSEIIQLANHNLVAVREIGRQLFSQNLNNYRNNTQEMLSAIKILESKWQDTREYAFKIFTTEFGKSEYTSSVLISICDSTDEEVRKLGLHLLTQHMQGGDIEEYILKFSEHPSRDMQMFVTNYLETHVANNIEHLRALVPYFNSVLSSVNRNGGAKKRVLSFLDKEASKSEEAAIIITEIIKRQSATMVTRDKATAIQIMLKIKKSYPHLELPILVQDVTEERRKSLINT
ncbi:hypothetical protein DSM106972_037990 [Dulcicalothrix desertica PCC 7102]|uniref:Uncharacterized protein n=1 Tax=Dulcicalothrix desertica PCC 7102 TaxID=232991 RepID=A0A433VFW0_9CYAN|nr:HEAT repeat domain-containing protein [Dulcicalothrix desertica]RUT04978.1 hypothetical protein DSM106972_037990 [Dulcicalothrix desertica PCC 7102]TWH43455.1 hypothetical protein CAL7102_07178 [Dulcicalothrix desertica PCC 7102]